MKIAVIIPCYNVKRFVLDVLSKIPDFCDSIYVVDDKCPEQSGKYVLENNRDSRVKVIFNEVNLGVGGAVLAGFQQALEDDMEVCVKIDGDGQMDPSIIDKILSPILTGAADYSKGNRFHSVYNVRQMPFLRLAGNAALSFMTKLSSGYWTIFDPTNGYVALHCEALSRLQTQNISKRYFFESDLLIHLRDIDAVVRDVPMDAIYGNEESGLVVWKTIPEFLFKHTYKLIRRILYQYYLRDFNLASLNFLFGLVLIIGGGIFGITEWVKSIQSNIQTPLGTIMLAVLPLILGFQSVIFALSIDITSEPKIPLQRDKYLLEKSRRKIG